MLNHNISIQKYFRSNFVTMSICIIIYIFYKCNVSMLDRFCPASQESVSSVLTFKQWLTLLIVLVVCVAIIVCTIIFCEMFELTVSL